MSRTYKDIRRRNRTGRAGTWNKRNGIRNRKTDNGRHKVRKIGRKIEQGGRY